MSRLSLVVGDTDEAFLESVVEYFISNHSKRFQVSSFTRQPNLVRYLNECSRKVDVLLVSPELYSENLPKEKIKTLIVMTGGRMIEAAERCDRIYKYQHGDKLANQILQIYTERNKDEDFTALGDKQAKVLAFVSPSGGSGTTTTAVRACQEAAEKGLSVFYLNLENVPSTANYFPCDDTQNLSNVLFYIKEKSKNLGLRIEAARKTVDKNIHYFSPQENLSDLEEMSPEELTALIRQLRSSNQYDVIIVDLSPGLSKQNLSVMKECDDLLLITAADSPSCMKLNVFEKELRLQSQKGTNLLDQCKIIINRGNPCMHNSQSNRTFMGKTPSATLPEIPFISNLTGLSTGNGAAVQYKTQLRQLLDELLYVI
ncbi:MAG: AAA family ATPase [Clostridia bacterium]|nr:AAA family ATPase [Clostridia bacterium]